MNLLDPSIEEKKCQKKQKDHFPVRDNYFDARRHDVINGNHPEYENDRNEKTTMERSLDTTSNCTHD